jgi:hypothetical protein
MACGACTKKRTSKTKGTYDVLGGYKYLPDKQIKARLEVFKKKYCADCDNRYKCDYAMYTACDIKQK